MKFESLYSFIEDNFHSRDKNENFYLVNKFCAFYCLDANKLKKILSDYGAYNDKEVIFNVTDKLPGETDIGSDIETPVEFAKRNKLYCKLHMGSWIDCEESEEGSVLNLNKAHSMMGNII